MPSLKNYLDILHELHTTNQKLLTETQIDLDLSELNNHTPLNRLAISRTHWGVLHFRYTILIQHTDQLIQTNPTLDTILTTLHQTQELTTSLTDLHKKTQALCLQSANLFLQETEK